MMRTRIHELVVQLVKWSVAGLLGWASTRGIDTSWAVGLETWLTLAVSAVVNQVLNVVADQLRRVSWLAPVVNIAWPNPHYQAADLNG